MVDFREKRQFARTAINAATRFRVEGSDTMHDGFLGNISVGGILLWTDLILSMGDRLCLFIQAEELADVQLEVTATVVRFDERKNKGQNGYGCRFDALYSGPYVE